MEGVADFVDDKYFEYFYASIIFSHEFAKAFWGENETTCNCCKTKNPKLIYDEVYDWYEPECCKGIQMGYRIDWQYHLQQMVLKKEPLTYLEKFL